MISRKNRIISIRLIQKKSRESIIHYWIIASLTFSSFTQNLFRFFSFRKCEKIIEIKVLLGRIFCFVLSHKYREIVNNDNLTATTTTKSCQHHYHYFFYEWYIWFLLLLLLSGRNHVFGSKINSVHISDLGLKKNEFFVSYRIKKTKTKILSIDLIDWFLWSIINDNDDHYGYFS